MVKTTPPERGNLSVISQSCSFVFLSCCKSDRETGWMKKGYVSKKAAHLLKLCLSLLKK